MSENIYTALNNPTAMKRLDEAGYTRERVESLISEHRKRVERSPTDFTYYPRVSEEISPPQRATGRSVPRPSILRSESEAPYAPAEKLRGAAGRLLPEKSEAVKARQMKSI